MVTTTGKIDFLDPYFDQIKVYNMTRLIRTPR